MTPRLSGTQLHARRVLVCLDGSKLAEVCVPYAVALAKTFRSAITLLHVMHAPRASFGEAAHDAMSWEIAMQAARGYLEREQREVFAATGQPVETRLEQGHPAERIVDVARELDVDLTIFASHGQAGVTAWNLGSTAAQVLAVTRSSVLVVHSGSTPPPSIEVKRVLVPLDGSLRAESVLPTVLRVAGVQSAEIVLVHVVPEPVPSGLVSDVDMKLARHLAGRLERNASRYLDRIREQLVREGASVKTIVAVHPNERECLRAISKSENVDLIVLSAHGSSCDSARPFGSVTTYLLTHSDMPLLVLQDVPEREVRRPGEIDAGEQPPALRASFAPEIP